jgi:hypothetical protein
MYIRFPVIIFFLLAFFSAKSQYYYKDILLTRQNQENWKLYHDLKVKEVDLQSLEASNEETPGFFCIQSVSPDFSEVLTYTKSANMPASSMTTFYDGSGRPIRSVDTSDTYQSTTEYFYNETGEISTLVNNSVETDNQVAATEKHIWNYDGNGPRQMVKIKGGSDTTIVNLVKDEKGNIIEEKAVRSGLSLPSVYYYYDNEGRLTDIVRYNQKAGRLLPDYVFEYQNGRISSRLMVPAGSTDYQKWIFTYNSNGLKASETCYDKKRQVVVKINYTYSFH